MIASVQDLVISMLMGGVLTGTSMWLLHDVLHVWYALAFVLTTVICWRASKRWDAHLAQASEVANMRITLWLEEEASA